jgi:hypothetical protein
LKISLLQINEFSVPITTFENFTDAGFFPYGKYIFFGVMQASLPSNFVFRQNGRNSLKNGRMRAVIFPPLILAEPTPKLIDFFFQFHPNRRTSNQFQLNWTKFGQNWWRKRNCAHWTVFK